MKRWADILCRLLLTVDIVFSLLDLKYSIVLYHLTMEQNLTCIHPPRRWHESGEYGALSKTRR
jgi:hypothetical protein